MSGIISEDGSDYLNRYHQRFNELLKKNVNISSVAGTLTESVVDGQNSNGRGQHADGTLSTRQFYQKHPNEDSHQFQAGIFSSKASSSSTFNGVSDASVFKKPLPLKRFTCRPLSREKYQLYIDFLCSLDNKQTSKFAMRTIEALVCSIKKYSTPPAQPVNPVYLMDYISNAVKEEYFSKQVPKSICGSSIMSDQASNIDQCSNSERSIQLDRPFLPSATSEPRIALQDITQASFYRQQFNRPPRDHLPNSELASISGVPGYLPTRKQNTSIASVAAKKKGSSSSAQQLLETLAETENTFNLLNDSELARLRDEAVAKQESMSLGKVPSKKSGKTHPKPTPSCNKVRTTKKASTTVSKKPTSRLLKESAPVSEKCSFDQTNKNISLLNGTAASVSRCGRVRKAPVKYWNSKGEDLSYTEPDESVFNESMTLRSKKIINKKKTPPTNSKSNTPLVPILENEIGKPSVTKPRGRPARSSLSIEKGNVESEKKPVKKQNDTSVKKQSDTTVQKNTVPKGKTNKKNEVKQNVEKTAKKSAPKRKLKESNALAYKKKKMEDPVDYAPSDDSEDDLFGGVSYKKKPTHQTLKVALSPSVALLSAKKAAGAAQGKSTPPCKAIGDMMMNESMQSVMSAAKEAPKQNEAVKRIIKKLEKTKMEASKTQVKKSRKENSNLMEDGKSTFYVKNPMCTASLTVFSGAEQNSDLSEVEEDDDDEDLM